MLALLYLLGWAMLISWTMFGQDVSAMLSLLAPKTRFVSLPVGSAASFAVVYVFTLAVAGVLDRLRLRVWVCCLAALVVGTTLGLVFLHRVHHYL